MSVPSAPVVCVCCRVGDPRGIHHDPESVVAVCSDCGAAVMASPETMGRHHNLGYPIVCIECYARYRNEGATLVSLRLEPPYAETQEGHVMTTDQFRALLDARPFRPFTVFFKGGQRAWITHSENVWCSLEGTLIVIEFPVDFISMTTISQITGIEYPDGPPGGTA